MSLVKTLYFHTLIVIGLILFSFGAQAQAQITVTVPSTTTAQSGTTVTIPVSITAPPSQVTGFRVTLRFNQNVIQALGPDQSNAALSLSGTLSNSCGLVEQDTITAGRIGIAGARCNITTAGTLINVLFSVVGASGTTTTITVDEAELIFEGTGGARFTGQSGSPGTLNVIGPTAASVNLSGRVLNAEGRGLRGAQVRLTAADGSTKTVMTSAFGYYRFADVQAGQSVTIQVMSKKYGFQPQIVNVSGDLSDLNFVAQP